MVTRTGDVGRPLARSSLKRRRPWSITNVALRALFLVAFAFAIFTFVSFKSVIEPSIHTNANRIHYRLPTAGIEALYRRQSISTSTNENKSTARHIDDPTPLHSITSSTSQPPRLTTGHLLTWILTSRLHDKDYQTPHAAYQKMRQSPAIPLEFLPGTLQLSHAQSLKYCFADPSVYSKHSVPRGDGKNVLVSYSDEYRLAYIMLPKSGSSTARLILEREFGARETRKSLQPRDYQEGGSMAGVEVITFVRDPLSRFYSQYEEAFIRTAPWVTNTEYSTFANGTGHPFSYLFDNMHSYHDYEDVFCPPSTRKDRKECVDRPSAENGTLAARFKRFVRDYDGRDPFDVHLTLQVPMLSSMKGYPLHVTMIYNTSDSEGGWRSIRKKFRGANNGTLEENHTESKSGGEVIMGRSYPRRLDVKRVSVETQRRICELTLLDYCCLNLPLPEVCRGKHYTDESGSKRELFCKLEASTGKGSERIQPGFFPEKAKSFGVVKFAVRTMKRSSQ